MPDVDPNHIAQRRADLAAPHPDVSEGMLEKLREVRRGLSICLPLRMDAGKLRTFTGCRVRHTDVRVAFEEGIRPRSAPGGEGAMDAVPCGGNFRRPRFSHSIGQG